MARNGVHANAKPTLDSDIAAFRYQHPMDSKSEKLKAQISSDAYLYECRYVFETFAFSCPEYGAVTFDVRGIKDALADRKLKFQMYEMALVPDFVEHVRTNNGVEMQRVAGLSVADLERPPIALLWPDGHSSFIDGNHRIVRRWDDGLRTLRFALVPVALELIPYMCKPGKEEQFIDRKRNPNMVPLATRIIKR